MSKQTILLVEDNKKILNTNAKMLRLSGYEITTAETLAQARAAISAHKPHLIILDIILPDGDGLAFCRELRETHKVPILFLSALGDTDDMLNGYMAGGVDYIAKPYSMDILLAKVQVLLRLTNGQADCCEIGGLRLDVGSHRAYLSGEDLLLKPKEYAVLELLIKNSERYLSPEQIYERLWALPTAEDVRTVHNHIYMLRSKLESSGVLIENKRGKGYRIVEKTEK